MPSTETSEDTWRAAEVEVIHDAMLKTNGGPIDTAALAQYFGLNEPDKDELENDEEAKKLSKDMKEQRTLVKKMMLARASLAGAIADKDNATALTFDEAVKELKQWVSADKLDDDKEKVKLAITLAKHARICQSKKATAMSILLKAKKDLSGKELKEVDEELIKVYGLFEGMEYLIENSKESIQSRFPALKRGV